MQKLHKGPNAALADLKNDLASDSLDWKDIQAKTKEFGRTERVFPRRPHKGEKENWKMLADSYFEAAKKLNAAAKKEEKDGVLTAFANISNACAACHKAHRPN